MISGRGSECQGPEEERTWYNQTQRGSGVRAMRLRGRLGLGAIGKHWGFFLSDTGRHWRV